MFRDGSSSDLLTTLSMASRGAAAVALGRVQPRLESEIIKLEGGSVPAPATLKLAVRALRVRLSSWRAMTDCRRSRIDRIILCRRKSQKMTQRVSTIHGRQMSQKFEAVREILAMHLLPHHRRRTRRQYSSTSAPTALLPLVMMICRMLKQHELTGQPGAATGGFFLLIAVRLR